MPQDPTGPYKDDWAIPQLRSAIDSHGLGVKHYSRRVLVRPPSTVYRWLSGSKPIPKCVREHLVGDFRILEKPLSTGASEDGDQEEARSR